MANWLERARREIRGSPNWTTADSDERGLTAVVAVAEQAESGKSGPSIGSNDSALDAVLLENEEAAIRVWLDHIDETDPAVIAEVLNKCRTDNEAQTYFLNRAEEGLTLPTFDDDRRYCAECTNLTPRGLCLAARRGEIKASRTYYPLDHIPKRCEGYVPDPNDSDRRLGRERWPILHQKGDNHADD